MKLGSKSFSQLLGEKLRDLILFALHVAQDPRLHLDRAWEASRKYLFSVICIAIVFSKSFHIAVHIKSLTIVSFFLWGPTFFLVDFLLILVACVQARSFSSPLWRSITAVTTGLWRWVTDSDSQAYLKYSSLTTILALVYIPRP